VKVLVLTSLYPNDANPQHGIFVENKVRHRLRHDDLDQTVIAPLPFLPRWAAAIPKYRALAAIPAYETRFGLAVWRPSYPALPRLSVSLNPLLMYLWVRPLVRRLLVAGFDFDLIDAHYFYPDGVAAALLGREFSRPVVITALGTDLNVLPRYAVPRRWILCRRPGCGLGHRVAGVKASTDGARGGAGAHRGDHKRGRSRDVPAG